MADKPSDDPIHNPFALPKFDFTEMLRQFQSPGVDFNQLIEEGRKNIEAVQQANQAVAEGWQAIAEKQADVFRETMEQWQNAVNEGGGASVSDGMERQAELAREGFEKALANMRQLADIAAESQNKAMEVMRARIEENIRALNSSKD